MVYFPNDRSDLTGFKSCVTVDEYRNLPRSAKEAVRRAVSDINRRYRQVEEERGDLIELLNKIELEDVEYLLNAKE